MHAAVQMWRSEVNFPKLVLFTVWVPGTELSLLETNAFALGAVSQSTYLSLPVASMLMCANFTWCISDPTRIHSPCSSVTVLTPSIKLV